MRMTDQRITDAALRIGKMPCVRHLQTEDECLIADLYDAMMGGSPKCRHTDWRRADNTLSVAQCTITSCTNGYILYAMVDGTKRATFVFPDYAALVTWLDNNLTHAEATQ